jgi:hypothetical protein
MNGIPGPVLKVFKADTPCNRYKQGIVFQHVSNFIKNTPDLKRFYTDKKNIGVSRDRTVG